MNKLTLVALAAAATLGAGAAQAYTTGTFKNGFVVPNVIHNGPSDTTAVGIINQSGRVVPVYWTFFDQNSQHVADGCFLMTDKDYQPFIWSEHSGTGMAGRRGYMVFAIGATGVRAGDTMCPGSSEIAYPSERFPTPQISGNAFQVNLTNRDVAFTPVIDGYLGIVGDLTLMGPTSLVVAQGAAYNFSTFSMRYFIDGAAGGDDTRIVVWSTGDQRGTHTVFMFDDKQDRRSVNFKLDYSELDWFDPETIPGRPAGFRDGFIQWTPNLAVPSDFPSTAIETSIGAPRTEKSVFTYSVIDSPAFGAVQTVLGAHVDPFRE